MKPTACVEQKLSTSNKSLTFRDGIKAGVPIAIGYIPIAIAFGLLAKSSGVPNNMAAMMSLVIFAGASQFVGVSLMSIGAVSWEIILTTFILNFRHFLMSASISQRLEDGISKRMLALLSFGITDETFSVASLKEEEKLSAQFLLALNLTAFSAWNAGTWIGLFAASGLPDIIKSSMGIALYAMFIGLLIPALKKSIPVLVVSLAAVGVHSLLHWLPLFKGLSTGWSIIISTITAAAIGAVLYPGEVNS